MPPGDDAAPPLRPRSSRRSPRASAAQVLGRLQLYEARGELSFRLATVERVGAGDHAAALDRLRRRLAAEGLFAAERKRPLPRFPRGVGLVTGVDAAARGDVVAAITTRFPAVRLVVAETRVQGPGATTAIVGALNRLVAARRRRRRDPRAGRRQLRGSPPLQRRARRPGGRRDRPSPSSPRSATSRTSRSATSPPTSARRRRRPPPGSSSPTSTSCRLDARARRGATRRQRRAPSRARPGARRARRASASRPRRVSTSSAAGWRSTVPPHGSRRSRPARRSRAATRSCAPPTRSCATRPR